MKVHHLNCGTMRPLTGRFVNHVLLVEADDGLVLVDTGFGLHDIADPTRLGPFRHSICPVLAEEETAARQIEALGFTRDDVRHIVATHLDFDHIGGAADFPQAQVHLTAAEARGARCGRRPQDRLRYRRRQVESAGELVEHDADGELWRGFAAAKELTDIAPGIVLIPMPGHTRGHACVAVDAGHRWVLHAGDAFFHVGTIDHHHRVPIELRAVESMIAHNPLRVRANHARLRELQRSSDPELLVVCSHDPTLLARAQTTAGPHPPLGTTGAAR